MLSKRKEKRETNKEEYKKENVEQQDCSLSPLPAPLSSLKVFTPFQWNIANQYARAFYESQGLQNPTPAYELKQPQDALLMQCRHCLRFSLGYCVKRGGQKPNWREPLHLVLGDGRRFRLEFACHECQMNVYSET